MKLRRVFSFFMGVIIAVTACVYMPPEEAVPAADAATATWTDGTTTYTYEKGCGHQNFSRTSTQSLLLAQPLTTDDALTAVTTNSGGQLTSGNFEGGGGLTYDGVTHSQKATITVSRANLQVIDYTTASTAQQGLMDAWATNRGAHIENAYLITSTGLSLDAGGNYYWGYDIIIQWDDPIDISKLTHLYTQFWIPGNITRGQSGILWFNLIGKDSSYSVDGWNYALDVSKLAPDSTGAVNTGQYYQFDLLSDRHTSYGTLSQIYKLVIRFRVSAADATSQGITKAPDLILGRFMATIPGDNIQPGCSYYNANGSVRYTADTIPDSDQAIIYKTSGTTISNSINSLRFPFYPDSKGTFLIFLNYGGFNWECYTPWSWRYKSSLNGVGSYTVSGVGGNFSSSQQRRNTKYVSDSTHVQFFPS